MTFDDVMATAARITEAAGVGVMLAGFAITALVAVAHVRRRNGAELYRDARQGVGRAILLGLELLVAADIMRTIVERPSLHDIAALAAIVAIRTFLSFALELELTGRLPWRARAEPSP